MRLLSVRELTQNPKWVWKTLKEGEEFIITSNGKPFALLTGVDEEDLGSSLQALRQTKALIAMEKMQESSIKAGLDKMTLDEIEEEITVVRKARNESGA